MSKTRISIGQLRRTQNTELQELRKILAPMTLKERVAYLNDPKWTEFFNKLHPDAEIIDALAPAIKAEANMGRPLSHICDSYGFSMKVVFNIATGERELYRAGLIKEYTQQQPPQRKFDHETYMNIRKDIDAKIPVSRIATKYKCNTATIHQMKKGKTYRDWYDQYNETEQ